jgi:hypothetical protein
LSTSATQLYSAQQSRRAVIITNEDASLTIRIGPSTVTNSGGTASLTGLAIPAGQTLALGSSQAGNALDASGNIYAIADSGTPAISHIAIDDEGVIS